jgi:thiol-disulfide isomerase/thioredoxin
MLRTLPKEFDPSRPGPAALIVVMVDWCGYCREFKPQLDKMLKIIIKYFQIWFVQNLNIIIFGKSFYRNFKHKLIFLAESVRKLIMLS